MSEEERKVIALYIIQWKMRAAMTGSLGGLVSKSSPAKMSTFQ